jgi:hypothetical protein
VTRKPPTPSSFAYPNAGSLLRQCRLGDLKRKYKMSYRGFTIEQERDGSYSIFNLGYVAGHFSTIQAAKENIDWRMDYHGRGKRLPFIRSH